MSPTFCYQKTFDTICDKTNFNLISYSFNNPLKLIFSKIIVKGETCTTIEYGPSDHNIWYIILRYDSHAREACEPCLA